MTNLQGITPACAGKTKEIRVRDPHGVGSPPHARGRPLGDVAQRAYARITPACAGKTLAERTIALTIEDHPRMRGEDWFMRFAICPGDGSPPHARGRPPIFRQEHATLRITPACAGKTELSLSR